MNFTATYTDQYQLKMAQIYFLQGKKDQRAVFDYFFRKLPFSGGYAVFAGLDDLLTILENFHFDPEDLNFLEKQGLHPDFLNYLRTFRFTGKLRAVSEGEIIFPLLPIVSIEANIIEAQLIETLLLNLLNFQTLIATKASRIRQIAGNRKLIDFGLRRAQGPGGYYASRAAIIGGFDGTSNVQAGRDYQIPLMGTMAHSFVQSYDDELSAFRDFAKIWPDSCILLVDTYDTLESGVPNAIKVAKELAEKGHHLKGIRLDSGDLAYLSKQARLMLDEAGLTYVKITVSNQLDEFVIKSLLEQKAPIDVYGVGTNLVIGYPDAALDGVYKLVLIDNKPRIKLSETLSKTTLPYCKQVYRIMKDELFEGADVIALEEEKAIVRMHHPFEPLKSFVVKEFKQDSLLATVMENGKRRASPKALAEIAQYSKTRLAQLPIEYKRFDNPHIYKIGISEDLKTARDQLVEKYAKRYL